MSKSEFRAMRIIETACQRNVLFADAAIYIGLPMPALTEPECKSIAVNVPYSWMYLRDTFPKAN